MLFTSEFMAFFTKRKWSSLITPTRQQLPNDEKPELEDSLNGQLIGVISKCLLLLS